MIRTACIHGDVTVKGLLLDRHLSIFVGRIGCNLEMIVPMNIPKMAAFIDFDITAMLTQELDQLPNSVDAFVRA